jgi:fatty acid desaturase
MRITTVGHLLKGQADRPFQEIALLACHIVLYGGLLYTLGGWEIALAFGAVHHATFGFYNSSVFASNHKGMLVLRDNDRMDFFREQVLTSRNVHGHPITDFWYGGLNYQIEHHLFPTMPRNRLREARLIVRAFCEQRAVAYHETGLFESYREGFRHLKLAGRGLPQTEGAV